MRLIEPGKNPRTVIPKQYQALEKIKFRTYKHYRPEYFAPRPLLDLCSAITDREQLPPCMLWTPEQMVDFLKQIGFPEFKVYRHLSPPLSLQEAFTKNQINGRTLMLVEADKLPKMNIKSFEKMKMLTSAIRNLYLRDRNGFHECTDPMIRLLKTLYLIYKTSRTGPTSYFMHPSLYYRKIKIIRDETAQDRKYYALINHWNRIPPFKEYCPHVMVGNICRINPMTGTTLRQNLHPRQPPYLLKEASFTSSHVKRMRC